MFAERLKEDRQYGAAREGLWDMWFSRWRDSRFMRILGEAGTRLFSPGKMLTFRLGQGKYMALSGVRYCRVHCERGAVWATAQGDGRDRVLTPGQHVTFARGGKVVISGRGTLSEVKVYWD